jgi:hypothetical protein
MAPIVHSLVFPAYGENPPLKGVQYEADRYCGGTEPMPDTASSQNPEIDRLWARSPARVLLISVIRG